MNEDNLREGVKTAFGSRIPSDVFERLVYLCRSFSLSPDLLFAKWESYAMEQNIDGLPLNYHQLDSIYNQLKKDLQSQSSQGLKSFQSLRYSSTQQSNFDHDSLERLLSNNPKSKHKPRIRDSLNASTPFESMTDTISNSEIYQSSPLTPTKRSAPTSAVMTTPTRLALNMDIDSSPSNSSPSQLSLQFADRKNKGKSEEIFNSHIPDASPQNDVNLEISLLPKQQIKGYRYMFEKLAEKAAILNDHIDDIADILFQQIKLNLSENEQDDFTWSNPGIPHQESVFAVGRICHESESDVRLNVDSIMLQCSPDLGFGTRVKLDLESFVRANKSFALFPGQVIAIEGTNPEGKSFFVENIYYPEPAPPQSTSLSQLLEYYPLDKEFAPIKIFVAAGPYTLDDSLRYEPLEEFVSLVEKEQPDCVVLLGPFVDTKHPIIESGNFPPEDRFNLSYFPDDIFRNQIATRVQRIRSCRQNTTRCVLIPSTRDAVSEWLIVPQPPLTTAMSDEGSNARKVQCGISEQQMTNDKIPLANPLLLFPNPVQFLINEMVFAVGALDTLRFLSTKEFAQQPSNLSDGQGSVHVGLDRIQRLYRHVLEQRSFCPLYPSAREMGASIDIGHLTAVELQALPDVLLMVSNLRFGVKIVDGCLCVNPGSLAKGRAGGTFAKFIVHPLELGGLAGKKSDGDVDMTTDEDDGVPHQVAARCRIEIQRI
ncbi:DNA-directed DNA polymerase alpha subunit pol12 [Nowakowskiella sp. JEL0078]|nr:DNA-directed DNA polymerase alpha subunit pol12 [Nowakowskiella sp. JEL0078]